MLIGLLRVIRALAGIVGVYQLIGLMPVFGFFKNLDQVPPGVWVLVAIKALLAAICLGLYFGLRKMVNRMHTKRTPETTTATPLLASNWRL